MVHPWKNPGDIRLRRNCNKPQTLADPAAGVQCSNAANTEERKIGRKVNFARGEIPSGCKSRRKCITQCSSAEQDQTSCKVWLKMTLLLWRHLYLEHSKVHYGPWNTVRQGCSPVFFYNSPSVKQHCQFCRVMRKWTSSTNTKTTTPFINLHWLPIAAMVVLVVKTTEWPGHCLSTTLCRPSAILSHQIYIAGLIKPL